MLNHCTHALIAIVLLLLPLAGGCTPQAGNDPVLRAVLPPGAKAQSAGAGSQAGELPGGWARDYIWQGSWDALLAHAEAGLGKLGYTRDAPEPDAGDAEDYAADSAEDEAGDMEDGDAGATAPLEEVLFATASRTELVTLLRYSEADGQVRFMVTYMELAARE